MSVLYVIGNGFDLHHGLLTGFADFRRYLSEVNPALERAINEHLSLDDQWSTLEAALATLDADELVDSLGMFLPSYSADDWSEAGHHDFDYEVGELTSALSADLLTHVGDWIRRVPRLTKMQALAAGTFLPIDPDARFMTFNYTPTLADVYGVPGMRTWQLHGRSIDPKSELVLGHGWKASPAPPLPVRSRDEEDDDDGPEEDARISQGRRRVEAYLRETYKPVETIIHEGRPFLEGLRDVTQVWVFGQSLDAVDLPYFAEIARCVQPSAHLGFSWFADDEREHHAAALIRAGFDPACITCGRLDQWGRARILDDRRA